MCTPSGRPVVRPGNTPRGWLPAAADRNGGSGPDATQRKLRWRPTAAPGSTVRCGVRSCGNQPSDFGSPHDRGGHVIWANLSTEAPGIDIVDSTARRLLTSYADRSRDLATSRQGGLDAGRDTVHSGVDHWLHSAQALIETAHRVLTDRDHDLRGRSDAQRLTHRTGDQVGQVGYDLSTHRLQSAQHAADDVLTDTK